MEKTKTTKFLGSFSLSKNGGSAGGTTNYDNLTNKPKVNGRALSGNKTSADLGITTLTPFPSTWPTTGQFEDLLAAIREDTIAVKGASFLGEVTFDDLPANLGNAEIKIEILEGTTPATKVIHSVITSGNREPYRWEYTSWNSGNSNSGWISFQLPLTAGDGISIENNVISTTGGNVYTQNNLLAGKGIEIVDEPVEGGIDEHTVLCLHLDGSLEDSANFGGTISEPKNSSGYAGATFGAGIFEKALNSAYSRWYYQDEKFSVFSEGKFTIDFWAKFATVANSPAILVYGQNGTNILFIVGCSKYNKSTKNIDGYINFGGSNVFWGRNISVPHLNENTWNHFAFIFNGSTIKLYVNGKMDWSLEYTVDLSQLNKFDFETGQNEGYGTTSVDELRVSNIERWTSDFEPPTQAYSLAVPTGNKVINNTITKTSQLTNDSGLITSDDVTKIKKLTQSEYDSLTTKDENTLYYIVG